MAKRNVPDLARDAEELLVEVARGGVEPVTYAWLAARLTETGDGLVHQRLVGQVLRQMRDRGQRSWAKHLCAFVVLEETGEPGDGYFDSAVGDATETRTMVHRRLTSGAY